MAEENENDAPLRALNLNSIAVLVFIEAMITCSRTITHLSTDPLFSCVVTLYALILLYFPHSLKTSLSPVLILTALLLLFLLRLGSEQGRQTSSPPSKEASEIHEKNGGTSCNVEEKSSLSFQVEEWVAHAGPDPGFEESFVEWNVRAPLEVIYEAYEGEEEEEEEEEEEKGDHEGDPRDEHPGPNSALIERYPSLSMYYPETDSDSSSDGGFPAAGEWNSPENVSFQWEEEDREGLLIEIALDGEGKKCYPGPGLDSGVHFEEDNLIEIDIKSQVLQKEDEIFGGFEEFRHS